MGSCDPLAGSGDVHLSRLQDGPASEQSLQARIARAGRIRGAALHGIGHAINHDRHNRHSYYLIKNGDLLGFEPVEIDMIALIARSHRKQAGKLDSPQLGALPNEKRRIVRAMVSILRVADALDRSHLNVVKDIRVACGPARV